jgi:ABC-type uncharacterized transport system fused permease/ATPase subunit
VSLFFGYSIHMDSIDFWQSIRVGSGKSSIISALLGEMYKLSGEVLLRGSVAYVAQTPWIMNATLRENILFGKKFDPVFYDGKLPVYFSIQ